MLGCTNFKADKTGCNVFMHSSEVTSDRGMVYAKFMNDVDLDKMKVCNHSIKKMYEYINKIIKDTKLIYPNFAYSLFTLADFLCGVENNSITKFALSKRIDYYGIIHSDNKKRLLKYLRCLVKLEIIIVNNENGFCHISLTDRKLSDDDLIDSYQLFINYNIK